jgi:hypothetical protein
MKFKVVNRQNPVERTSERSKTIDQDFVDAVREVLTSTRGQSAAAALLFVSSLHLLILSSQI